MNAPMPGELTVDQDQERKRKKRGAIVKLSLAGVALLGIGAAATSAAWTDDAWFKGTATAASVNLQGSVDNATWDPADTQSGALTFDVSGSLLGALNQKADVLVPLYLYNAGDQPLALTVTQAQGSGAIFTDIASPSDAAQGGVGAKATVSVPDAPATIAAHDHIVIHVEVKTDANWSKDYRGKSGSLVVQLTGK
jgi:predicted ribosomally synthesized peptide with SipW-like signal peptide